MKRSKSLSPELDVSFRDESVGLGLAVETAGNNAPDSGSIVGQVLERSSNDNAGRAVVRWRTQEGELREQAVAVVKGVLVEGGDLVLLQRPGNWPEWIVTHVVTSLGNQPMDRQPEAVVDGRRVQIEGKDEVVLRCGQASITLRRNGRVIIRGTYVESRSSGTNRIKGGAVLIN